MSKYWYSLHCRPKELFHTRHTCCNASSLMSWTQVSECIVGLPLSNLYLYTCTVIIDLKVMENKVVKTVQMLDEEENAERFCQPALCLRYVWWMVTVFCRDPELCNACDPNSVGFWFSLVPTYLGIKVWQVQAHTIVHNLVPEDWQASIHSKLQH